MSEHGRSKVALGAGAALGATVVFAPAAEAATFTVTNLNNDGPGSLRQAVVDANTAAGEDIVTFQSGLSGTITLSGADSDIEIYTDGLTIQGPGANQITINGGGADRIFWANNFDTNGEPLVISGLTLTNGFYAGLGGALYTDDAGVGGFAPEVTIRDSVFTGNTAEGGGAIWTDYGSLTIENSVFTNNKAVANNGGGALYTDDTDGDLPTELVIRNSTFTGNIAEQAGDGGAITVNAADASILIEGTTISGNTAGSEGGAYGGGLNVNGLQTGGVTINSSTISGNNAFYGGGVYLYGVEQATAIRNSTISGNRVTYGGGGIWVDNQAPVVIQNSTIVDNVAATYPGAVPPGGGYGGGGVYLDQDATIDTTPVTISSSIVANNTADFGADLAQDSEAGGFIVGFSLFENAATQGVTTSPVTEDPAGSNITGAEPQLGPLADNGGPTRTHAPTVTSPALDAGVANSLGQDQRGLPRTADLPAIANRPGSDATDMGAVEARAASCQGVVVFAEFNATAGDDTLAGTDGNDSLVGLAGNDTIKAAGGNDCLSGDEGKDKLRGQGGKDQAKGGAGKDNLSGGGGKDKVVGGDGKDQVKGGGGKDKLKGNAGKDKIKAADGAADKVNCGAGEDKATVDAKDKVSPNCEDVTEKG